MKIILHSIVCCLLFQLFFSYRLKAEERLTLLNKINYVQAFQDTLTSMIQSTQDEYLKINFSSIKEVISYYMSTSTRDTGYVKSLYDNFNNKSLEIKATDLSSYAARRIPLIVSWVSPTDGKVSLSWLTLPLNWDPSKQCPMYVDLHCDFEEASNPIRYMVYPFLHIDDYQPEFENGYLFQPWGRGNEWYENIAETDIWEGIHKLQSIVNIDFTRMYLSGWSMGGCGTWKMSLKSPNYWAAIGIIAGALSMGGNVVNEKNAQILKNLPVFWAMGIYDSFYSINYNACKLLIEAGNKNTKFNKFWGGHECPEDQRIAMYKWMQGFTNNDFSAIDNVTTFEKRNLIQAYPNPVKNICNISYYVPENSNVSINIIDLYGKIVTKLENSFKHNGSYEIQYNTEALHAGVYIISIRCGSNLKETKMTVVK